MFRITHACCVSPLLGTRFSEPYDAAFLRGLEQQVDEGDATLERCPERWAYTHSLETSTGAVYLVFVTQEAS